jgi:hypothetical protein
LKRKISTTPVLRIPNLQQPFEIEIDANAYDMGVFLMQHRKPNFFNSKTFSKVVCNYPTYNKELYALVQSMNKWKYYLMGKEMIIQIDHQPLQYLQSQTKL